MDNLFCTKIWELTLRTFYKQINFFTKKIIQFVISVSFEKKGKKISLVAKQIIQVALSVSYDIPIKILALKIVLGRKTDKVLIKNPFIVDLHSR